MMKGLDIYNDIEKIKLKIFKKKKKSIGIKI